MSIFDELFFGTTIANISQIYPTSSPQTLFNYTATSLPLFSTINVESRHKHHNHNHGSDNVDMISESKDENDLLIHKINPKYSNVQDYPTTKALDEILNDRYNANTVIFSIENGEEQNWNVSNTGNITSMFSGRPEWHNTLDKVVSYIMLVNVINVMLGMGSAIYIKQVLKSLWPPIGILIGMCGQFILIPLLGFGTSILFGLRPYEALGCLVVSCSPGGTFSNFFTYWLEGDLALSIIMTSCSSVLALVAMPLNLWLYSSYYVGDQADSIVIPYLNILRSLAFIGGPVIVGMIIRHFSEKVASVIVRVSSIAAFFGFTIVLTCWSLLYWRIFLAATSYIYLSAILLPIVAFSSAYLAALLCRRSQKVCRTIGVETGSQNMPVAASIILLSFDQPEVRAEMLLFPTLYGIFLICEMLICIIIFKSVKKCRNKRKKAYSEVNKATLENGTASEKENINMRNY